MDKRRLIDGVLRLPLVSSTKSDVEEYGIEDFDASQFGELPCLSDRERAVRVQLRFVNETGAVAGPGQQDVSRLLPLTLTCVLPDLDMGNIGFLDCSTRITLVKHGGYDALAGMVVVCHDHKLCNY